MLPSLVVKTRFLLHSALIDALIAAPQAWGGRHFSGFPVAQVSIIIALKAAVEESPPLSLFYTSKPAAPRLSPHLMIKNTLS